jgi:hypothetical protein
MQALHQRRWAALHSSTGRALGARRSGGCQSRRSLSDAEAPPATRGRKAGSVIHWPKTPDHAAGIRALEKSSRYKRRSASPQSERRRSRRPRCAPRPSHKRSRLGREFSSGAERRAVNAMLVFRGSTTHFSVNAMTWSARSSSISRASHLASSSWTIVGTSHSSRSSSSASMATPVSDPTSHSIQVEVSKSRIRRGRRDPESRPDWPLWRDRTVRLAKIWRQQHARAIRAHPGRS